ncbi:hydroxyethylthiazole kinase [Rubrobacter indicoceani]|uniref:hydroxyethylthiazole kinase n=1 Tax=Rubrobacter indicoceani TaxID=2051957 RepID=UPI000E5AFC15|nr:hydroxyethylthiazole kinase [Rubrobacter indicoceani]
MNAGKIFGKLSDRKPLIHHLTNYVTANLVANVTLAVGALPVMAQAGEEVEEMTGLASALVINIGTLDPNTVEAMLAAGKTANGRGIPVVLDPVGAGATTFRTGTVGRILDEVSVSVICGNAGEIATIAGLEAEVRGVESLGGDAKAAVVSAARSLGTVVSVTGSTDYVSDGERLVAVRNGDALMGRIVGSGCASTAVVASFVAVGGAGVDTVAAALACYGYAGEDAARRSDGPGTFEPRFLDALHALSGGQEGLDGRLLISSEEIPEAGLL